MKPIYKEKYPHLFEPMYVGKNKVRFNNRVLVGPMGSGATGGGEDSDGRINTFGIDFWMRYIQGGFSSVALPMEVPIDGSHEHMFNLNPKTCNQMNFQRLQRAVHAFNGKTFAEFLHGGPYMRAGFKKISADDEPHLGSVAATVADMEEVASLFGEYAHWAQIANFDGLLLHYGHGWLFNYFLSPLTNHRTDEFGGSIENRCRFPLMVIKAIRATVGDSMLIELRMNGNDEAEGGITPEECAEQVKIFEPYIDMVHITCGHRVDAMTRPKQCPTGFDRTAHNAYASEIVKKSGVKIPVGTIGGIYSPEVAEEVLAKGQADYVLMSRSAMADPEIIKKAKEGREDDIRPCLRCNYCMDHGRRVAISKDLHLLAYPSYDRQCMVNPLQFQSAQKLRIPPSDRQKKVAVVGGGVAGMEAAISCAMRGHTVVLYEKTDRLGGQALLSDPMWFKKEMKLFHEYLERQVKKRPSITVVYNTEATPEIIDQNDFDAVIVAVGAEQIVPRIPGVEKATMSFDVFGHEDKVGKKVVIIGGGAIGVELGIHLNGLGRECTVVEMGEYIAAKAQLTERTSYLNAIKKYGVKTMVNARCTEITDKGATVETPEGSQFLEADTVIIAVGTKSLVAERDKFIDTAFDVINVGDCVEASSIVHAVHTGFDAGLTL
ncbi:FAD-dependent oxidoreductase [uncultured Mailhella sp.]|uniref:oxidoreductase n=1 Tax=uncultured Mailhella sp. TaxID=1981031 RepID=UPI0025D290B9|nr:FAD-dependent oxidoreductase [uncultured Mailhella sp.]